MSTNNKKNISLTFFELISLGVDLKGQYTAHKQHLEALKIYKTQSSNEFVLQSAPQVTTDMRKFTVENAENLSHKLGIAKSFHDKHIKEKIDDFNKNEKRRKGNHTENKPKEREFSSAELEKWKKDLDKREKEIKKEFEKKNQEIKKNIEKQKEKIKKHLEEPDKSKKLKELRIVERKAQEELLKARRVELEKIKKEKEALKRAEIEAKKIADKIKREEEIRKRREEERLRREKERMRKIQEQQKIR